MRVLQFKKYNIFWSFSMLEYDTENLNSEEIYSSLRGVTEAIEKFSFRSQEDLNEPIKRDGKKDCDIVSISGLTENYFGEVRTLRTDHMNTELHHHLCLVARRVLS